MDLIEFDKIVNNFLRRVYSNVEHYTSTNQSESDNIYINGTVYFKSGNSKAITFFFDRNTMVGGCQAIGRKRDALTLVLENGKPKFIDYHFRSRGCDGDKMLRINGRARG